LVSQLLPDYTPSGNLIPGHSSIFCDKVYFTDFQASCSGKSSGKERRTMDFIASFVAQYLYIIVLALVVGYLIWQHRARWLELLFAAVFIGGVAFLLAKITGLWISDPRPFVVTGQPPLFPHDITNGFPSDHTLLVAAVAAVVALANWRVGLVVWALALLIGLARVYAGVHHLLDIAGSLVLVVIALGGYILIKRMVGLIISRNVQEKPTSNLRERL
jgi:undecaprenyl-diphosphatase